MKSLVLSTVLVSAMAMHAAQADSSCSFASLNRGGDAQQNIVAMVRDSLAQALASKAPEAFAVARRLMRGHKPRLDAQLAEEGEAFKRAVRGPEAREAFAAFFEKRKPVF